MRFKISLKAEVTRSPREELQEPQPEGSSSVTERSVGFEPNEMNQHHREPEWEDRS